MPAKSEHICKQAQTYTYLFAQVFCAWGALSHNSRVQRDPGAGARSESQERVGAQMDGSAGPELAFEKQDVLQYVSM